MRRLIELKKTIVAVIIALVIASVFSLNSLKFSFDFDQFFPEGDEDLIFYQNFTKEFGKDDSFLLIAIENDGSVFENDFLDRFHKFSLGAKKLPYVKESLSLTTLFYPLKTSFGYTKLPIIHLGDSTKYDADWKRLQKDGLFLNSLIDTKATSMMVALETDDDLDYSQSVMLLSALREALQNEGISNYHLLGRSFFYEAIVEMQIREIMVTSAIAIVLVFLILYVVYRRISVVLISIISISFSLVLFLGVLALLGRELNAMAALYPVLMLIVGTSDVIHIMDNFLMKLRRGIAKESAIISAMKEVGLVTFLTSATTVVGFISLMSSRLRSINDFGINSAIGVLVAYITVVFFTGALLLLIDREYLLPKGNPTPKWPIFLSRINHFTKQNPVSILVGSALFVIMCFWGISKINTNFKFNENLPRGGQIAIDFDFFQKNYTGFRPLEIAISAKNGTKVTDFELVKDMALVEDKLKSFEAIGNVQSLTLIYKGINRANHLNKQEYFVLPESNSEFQKYKAESQKLASRQLKKFINEDESKARITSRVLDVGTDSLAQIYREINKFVATHTDTTESQYRLTGKGMLLDKNSVYVRDSLINGLLIGLLLVSVLLAFLFKDWRLLLVSLIPNLIPLLFAGALLGFLGIPLEASIAVVFAIVFGIAVDDTIHFLGKYKICKSLGISDEEAMDKTFRETGRALIITSLVLFFGFMVLLFSINRPSLVIGLLISITLLSALVMDLLLLPVLLRKLVYRKNVL